MSKLQNIFDPRSIAVIGASNRIGSVGYALMNNLLNSEYSGKVFPVNIKGGEILGVKAYENVGAIVGGVDLVIVATPAATVPGIVTDCGESGVKGIVIISSGFAEVGKQGQALFREIKSISQKYGIRVIGPNCLGFIIPSLGINATFSNKMARAGKIAFISQSGALCTAILDWSEKHSVGFSHFVSIGSMIDVDFSDLLEYFGQDDSTNSIFIYMESLKEADKFRKVAKSVSLKKPIVLMKVGKSADGARAARSHTGSLAGDDAVFDAAFRQVGVIRVKRSQELFNLAKLMDKQPIPLGNRLAVVTNAGGPGVIATDAIVETGAEVAKLQKSTIQALDKVMPAAWSKANPVDIIGDAGPLRYKQAIDICLKDKNTDASLVILTPQAMTSPGEVAHNLCGTKNGNKPIMASWMGGSDVESAREELSRCGVPVFDTPEEAIQSFSYLAEYWVSLKNIKKKAVKRFVVSATAKNRAAKLIQKAIGSGHRALNEAESKELLGIYGIPVLPGKIVNSEKEAGEAFARVGKLVAMKILSPDILHKTDVGGVVLGVDSASAAKKTYRRIIQSVKKHKPKAMIDGVYMEAMVKKPLELLIGLKYDDIFGPVIVFGTGGTKVELLKDTNIGFPPLDEVSALDLVSPTMAYKLIKGYRGQKGADMGKLTKVLMNFSSLVIDFPILEEIDINPFSVDEQGGYALDAKVILDKNSKVV